MLYTHAREREQPDVNSRVKVTNLFILTYSITPKNLMCENKKIQLKKIVLSKNNFKYSKKII